MLKFRFLLNHQLIFQTIIFYYLKGANLNNCEYETLFDFDEGGENEGQSRVELTIKKEGSDENGD